LSEKSCFESTYYTFEITRMRVEEECLHFEERNEGEESCGGGETSSTSQLVVLPVYKSYLKSQ
jgi:hypothetical protein